MKRFVRTWFGPLWVGACALIVTIAVLLGGKVYPWEVVVWAANCTAWAVLAEVRFRVGKKLGRVEEQERQQAWWH